MKYVITPIVGLLLALVGIFIAPPVMFFARYLIKWDKEPSNGSYGQNPTIRGDLPKCLRWFQTPDERFPGGLYEPTVQKWLDTKGRTYCSYKWAGWRNQLMGLAAALGKSTTDYIPETPLGFWARKDKLTGDIVWRYSKGLKWFKFVCG